MADMIERHWNNLARENLYMNTDPIKFKLRRQEIKLEESMPSTQEKTDNIHFLRPDHARFWYSNESALFTDTGNNRVGNFQNT